MKKVDGRISIAKRGEPLDITLVADSTKTSYQPNPNHGTFADRSGATASGLIVLGLSTTGPQASRLSEIDSSISRELEWVRLSFRRTEDMKAFEAAFAAFKDSHEFLYEAERHGTNRQPLGARGSLTRKYESAVLDADDVIPLVAGSLGSNLDFRGRNSSYDVLDADPQRSTNSSNTSNEVGKMRRLGSRFLGNTRWQTRTPLIRVPLSLSTKSPYAAQIANISFSTTKKDIRDRLADCALTDVRITEERLGRRLVKIAYATFATLEGLEKALDLSTILPHDGHKRISVVALRNDGNN